MNEEHSSLSNLQDDYFYEIDLVSPILKQREIEANANWALDVPPPPSATLALLKKSFNTSNWEIHQFVRSVAHPGTLFELYTNVTSLNPLHLQQLQTYALLRINHPQYWIKFSIHYLEGESIRDIVLQYVAENNLQVEVSDVIPPPERIFNDCIASIRLVPTPIGTPIEWQHVSTNHLSIHIAQG